MSKILKAACIVGLFLFSLGQKVAAQGFGGGLSVGMNAAQINGDSASGFNKVGLNAGVLINRKLNKSFSWQFELLYSRKGSRTRVDTNTSGPPSRYFHNKLTYVEVPILLNWNVYERFRVQAGFCYAILNDATHEEPIGVITNTTRSFYRTDYNTVFGLEYDLTNKFSVNVRYTNSLINISRYSPSSNGGVIRWYNIVTAFSIRYNLRK